MRIADRRPSSLSLFGELSDQQAHQLATDAWIVGLRALANAYAQAQESRLRVPFLHYTAELCFEQLGILQ